MKFKKVDLKDDDNNLIQTVEYCPDGHMNNTNLDDRTSNVCPISECKYSEVNK